MEKIEKREFRFSDMYEKAFDNLCEICKITDKTPSKRKDKTLKLADNVWEIIKDKKVYLYTRELTKDEMQEELTGVELSDEGGRKYDVITGGCLYLIVIEEIKDISDENIIELYYKSTWIEAVVSALVDWTRNCKAKEQHINKERIISYAPGMDGNDIRLIKNWLIEMKGKELGIQIGDYGLIVNADCIVAALVYV
ncbi:MAG: hypothetical protein ACI4EF_01505 [Coprococcus sp.]